MRFDKLTSRLQEAVANAQSLALSMDHQFIDPEHMLQALLQQQNGSAASLLVQAGANLDNLQTVLQKSLQAKAQVSNDQGDVHLAIT